MIKYHIMLFDVIETCQENGGVSGGPQAENFSKSNSLAFEQEYLMLSISDIIGCFDRNYHSGENSPLGLTPSDRYTPCMPRCSQ